MKCQVCGIEMRLTERKDGAAVWVCRNPKCPQSAKKPIPQSADADSSPSQEEPMKKEDTHGTD